MGRRRLPFVELVLGNASGHSTGALGSFSTQEGRRSKRLEQYQMNCFPRLCLRSYDLRTFTAPLQSPRECAQLRKGDTRAQESQATVHSRTTSPHRVRAPMLHRALHIAWNRWRVHCTELPWQLAVRRLGTSQNPTRSGGTLEFDQRDQRNVQPMALDRRKQGRQVSFR